MDIQIFGKLQKVRIQISIQTNVFGLLGIHDSNRYVNFKEGIINKQSAQLRT